MKDKIFHTAGGVIKTGKGIFASGGDSFLFSKFPYLLLFVGIKYYNNSDFKSRPL